MSLFENEKLTKVNEKIEEITAKIETLQSEVAEYESSFAELYEKYILGELKESDVKKAEKIVKDKKTELTTSIEMLRKLKSVKKKVAVESVPFVKEARAKKTKVIQMKYDEQVTNVHKARAAFLEELAKLGKIKNEVSGVNYEYQEVMREMGKDVSFYDVSVLEGRKIHSPKGYTKEVDCIGITVGTQENVYSTGRVPHGFGSVSK